MAVGGEIRESTMTQTNSRNELPPARLEELRRRVFELQALVARRKTADQALCCLQLALQQLERQTQGEPQTRDQGVGVSDERDNLPTEHPRP